MKRAGFTLIELMLASALSVMLMAGVMMVMSGLSRDARQVSTQLSSPVDLQGTMDLLQWDLSNARKMYSSPDRRSLVLIGHGSIAPGTLRQNARLVRVSYTCQLRRTAWRLMRSQQYIDDPARPQPWTELVAQGVSALEVIPVGEAQTIRQDEGSSVDVGIEVPPWVRLRVYGPAAAMEKMCCVK